MALPKRTVADFRRKVLRDAGLSMTDYPQFTMRSSKHAEFWARLHSFGYRNAQLSTAETSNIDATAVLKDADWRRLEAELASLLNPRAA